MKCYWCGHDLSKVDSTKDCPNCGKPTSGMDIIIEMMNKEVRGDPNAKLVATSKDGTEWIVKTILSGKTKYSHRLISFNEEGSQDKPHCSPHYSLDALFTFCEKLKGRREDFDFT